jgi:hypothetical protein
VVRSFERHLRAENRSDQTVTTYLTALRQAEAFLTATRGTTLAQAGRADLEAYLGDLLTRRAPAAVGRQRRQGLRGPPGHRPAHAPARHRRPPGRTGQPQAHPTSIWTWTCCWCWARAAASGRCHWATRPGPPWTATCAPDLATRTPPSPGCGWGCRAG